MFLKLLESRRTYKKLERICSKWKLIALDCVKRKAIQNSLMKELDDGEMENL